MKTWKRMLAVSVAFAMTVTSMPTSSFVWAAEDTVGDAAVETFSEESMDVAAEAALSPEMLTEDADQEAEEAEVDEEEDEDILLEESGEEEPSSETTEEAAAEEEEILITEEDVWDASDEVVGLAEDAAAAGTKDNPITLTPGQTYDVQLVNEDPDNRTSIYYIFTPQETGWYYIYSEGDSDPYVELADSNISDDDSGTGYNFALKCELQAGQSYLYRVWCYDNESNFKIHFETAVGIAKVTLNAALSDHTLVSGLESTQQLMDENQAIIEITYTDGSVDEIDMLDSDEKGYDVELCIASLDTNGQIENKTYGWYETLSPGSYGFYASVWVNSAVTCKSEPIPFTVISVDGVQVNAKNTDLIAGLDSFADAEASAEVTASDQSKRTVVANHESARNGWYFEVKGKDDTVVSSSSDAYYENFYGAGTYTLTAHCRTGSAIKYDSSNSKTIQLNKISSADYPSLTVNAATAVTATGSRQMFSFRPSESGMHALKATSGKASWYKQTESKLEKTSGNLTEGETYIVVLEGLTSDGTITVQRNETETAMDAAEKKVNDANPTDAYTMTEAVAAVTGLSNEEIIDSDLMNMVTDLEDKLLQVASSETAANVGSTVVKDENNDVKKIEGAAITVAAALNDDTISATSGTYAAQIAVDEAKISADEQGKMSYTVNIVMNIVNNQNAVVKENVKLQAPIRITMDIPYSLWYAEFDLYHGDTKISYTRDDEEETITFETPSLSPFTLMVTSCIDQDHSWGDWKVVKAATCAEQGTKERICEVCGEKKTAVIAKTTAHTMITIPAVAATCTTVGKTEGSSCSVCGKIFTAQTEIPALGHSWSGWTKTSEATVFAEAQQTRRCNTCGITETQKVGGKVPATISLTASSLKMKTKQSTTKFRAYGFAAGDYVTSVVSSNTKAVKVSKVSANGTFKLTAQKQTGKKGTATITVTLASGKTASFKVTVQKGAVKTSKITVTPGALTLTKGQKAQLSAEIAPITSTQKITYSSSNKKVATVNSKGKVTAKKKGTAKITVKSGSKKKTIKVTVK